MFLLTDGILIHAIDHLLQQSAFADLIDDSSISDDLHRHPKLTRDRKKIRFSTDYSQTNWGRFIVDPSVKDPHSKQGKLFRRRFRVPYTLFCWLCNKWDEVNVFEVKRAYSVEIPTYIKVMISLRLLGRGDCQDSISEFCGVSESYCRTIFLQFVHLVEHAFKCHAKWSLSSYHTFLFKYKLKIY